LELSSSQDVTSETEGLVLPMYRALLARLDYAQTPKLAALEFDLETDGRLDAFEATFAEVNGRTWRDSRDTVFAVNLASKTLSALDPSAFPSADSWAKAFEAPALTSKWFVRRAVDLVDRRGRGATRVVFVVDEVSQYIARSIDRIRAMQGVAERFQELGGRLWLIATGQERLEEVVDGLEGKQHELQRLRDRFPLAVDLLPSDIHEVVSRRVLDKNEAGRAEVARVLGPHRQKFAANTRLDSSTRSADPSEEELVRLYPLLPYQVQLLIDAVSKRRSHVRSSTPMGGSNRTVIKHAQQLITSSKVGLGGDDVGALVTIDRSYDLLEEVIPTSWRAEVEQVAARYSGGAEVPVIKAIALMHDVPALPLTAHNIAVLLHERIDGETRRDEVTAALGHLVTDDRVREVDGRFQLQSAEQKQWDQERREIALTMADERELRGRLLTEMLKGLTVNVGRAFAVGLAVDGEQRAPGDLMLDLVTASHADHLDQLRARSRESANLNRIYWLWGSGRLADLSEDDTYRALEELHKSNRMIARHDVPSNGRSQDDAHLIADEKTRQARAERNALGMLAADLSRGEVVFQGVSEPAPAGDPRAGAQSVVRERLPSIYPQLDHFAAAVDAKDALLVLRTDDLGTVAPGLGVGGIGLVELAAAGAELVTARDPLAAFVAEVKRRTDYGEVPTGQVLERHFGGPPYGAPVGVVQVLTAAALRSGLVEVVYQGQVIGGASDRRLDAVFRTLPAFRQTEVRPPRDTGPDAKTRTRLARKLQEYTGEPQSPHLEELATHLRERFLPQTDRATEVAATMRGAALTVPPSVERVRELLGRLASDDNAEVVITAADNWEDLLAGLAQVEALAQRLDDDLDVWVAAKQEVGMTTAGLGEPAEAQRRKLEDLLATGDYVSHRGEIRSLVAGLTAARDQVRDALRGQLEDGVEVRVAELRGEFGDVEEEVLAQMLQCLVDLLPPEHAEIDVLKGRLAQLQEAGAQTRRGLEELLAAGRLVEVRVSDIVKGLITDVPALDVALDGIRTAALAALDEGKEVRLT
jgi:hypothetical protein